MTNSQKAAMTIKVKDGYPYSIIQLPFMRIAIRKFQNSFGNPMGIDTKYQISLLQNCCNRWSKPTYCKNWKVTFSFQPLHSTAWYNPDERDHSEVEEAVEEWSNHYCDPFKTILVAGEILDTLKIVCKPV